MGMKKKLTVELPPETMILLDKLTDISGTGSRGRTVQLMAETIASLEQDVAFIMERIKTGVTLDEHVYTFVLTTGKIAGPLTRFYPRKPVEKNGLRR